MVHPKFTCLKREHHLQKPAFFKIQNVKFPVCVYDISDFLQTFQRDGCVFFSMLQRITECLGNGPNPIEKSERC